MKYPVFFSREKLTMEFEEGTTLLQAQILAGLRPDAPCGGSGRCGKCAVILEDSRGRRRVSACQTRISGPITLDTGLREQDHAIALGGTGRAVLPDPVYRRGTVTLTRPRDNASRWQQLTRDLRTAFGEDFSDLPPDLPLASRLWEMRKESAVWQVILGPRGIVRMTREARPCYAAALDIGTTTLVAYLLDLDSGRTAAACSRINPQTQYGADVILRADYAMKNGPDALRSCLLDAIREMLRELADRASIPVEEICGVCAVGNTCMHHLLLGLSPASLVRAPYSPVIRDLLILPARDLGLPGDLILLPNIGGFVGSDTLGCLLADRPDLHQEVTLLIDVGTNGELVLCCHGELTACSTAAGPAFEGAKISCGMRGAAGAVDHVAFRDGVWSYTTVGGAPARGLCGSGLIDLTACLRRAGLISPTGALREEQFPLAPGVSLTRQDVREVQLAKAAIAAGIRVLLNRAGLEPRQVDRVLVAGAFGTCMDPVSACAIGLIPPCLEEKILPVGNAAGEGAKIALLSRAELEETRNLAEKTEFLELAASPEFQEYFVDELEFP